MSGVDSANFYFYRDGSLVAVVNDTIGMETCSAGPEGFKVPECGGYTFLCPFVDASTSDPESEGGASANADAPDGGIECDGSVCGD